MSAPTRLTIDVWSDVMCPWCAIGYGQLSKALAEAGCPVVSLTSDTMSLEDIFLQITETAPEEAQPEETEEPAPEAAAAQPEQSAEPAEPQAPADDTPEQPEAENDQKEEE